MIYNEAIFDCDKETFRSIYKYLSDAGLEDLYPEAYIDFPKRRIAFWADTEILTPFEDLSGRFPDVKFSVTYFTELMDVRLDCDFLGGKIITRRSDDITEILNELRL